MRDQIIELNKKLARQYCGRISYDFGRSRKRSISATIGTTYFEKWSYHNWLKWGFISQRLVDCLSDITWDTVNISSSKGTTDQYRFIPIADNLCLLHCEYTLDGNKEIDVGFIDKNVQQSISDMVTKPYVTGDNSRRL